MMLLSNMGCAPRTGAVLLALAAMSLNFLLGFTGVLSFGHAAYFGLGAYGAGLAIKYVYPDTLFGIAVGVLVGTAAAAVIGPMIIRTRLMKASPRGLVFSASPGAKCPRRIPTSVAARTWNQSCPMRRRRGGAAATVASMAVASCYAPARLRP